MDLQPRAPEHGAWRHHAHAETGIGRLSPHLKSAKSGGDVYKNQLYTSMQIIWFCTILYQSFKHSLHGQVRPGLGWVAVLLWALSLHTVLYLGIIWKDVLIAYGLVFIAALAYRIRREPLYQPTLLDATLLGISLFLCLGLRHGMVFNAILVPALIGWRRVVAVRRLWVPMALAPVSYTHLDVYKRQPLRR